MDIKDKYPKYLPIGSVILLNGGKKRIMIMGYAQVDEKAKKEYDYIGCMYPEGIVYNVENILFNHNDIANIYCIGFINKEQKEFNKVLEDHKQIK